MILLKPHLSSEAERQYIQQWEKHDDELLKTVNSLARMYAIAVQHIAKENA